MFPNRKAISIAILWILSNMLPTFANPDGSEAVTVFSILEASFATQRGGPPKALDLLYELDAHSDNPETDLVTLSDYYLGAGGGEIWVYLVTKRGLSMRSMLSAKIGTPLMCMPKFQSICMASISERDARLKEMIQLIDKGEVLKPAE